MSARRALFQDDSYDLRRKATEVAYIRLLHESQRRTLVSLFRLFVVASAIFLVVLLILLMLDSVTGGVWDTARSVLVWIPVTLGVVLLAVGYLRALTQRAYRRQVEIFEKMQQGLGPEIERAVAKARTAAGV